LSLEYVVRPYQARNAQGAILIPAATAGGRQRATLTWGRSSPRPPAQSITFKVNCCNETQDETARKTETVRIYQPDNPENYIDVARATQVKLHKTEANGCDEAFNILGFSDMAMAAPDGVSPTDASSNLCASTWNLSNNTTQP